MHDLVHRHPTAQTAEPVLTHGRSATWLRSSTSVASETST